MERVTVHEPAKAVIEVLQAERDELAAQLVALRAVAEAAWGVLYAPGSVAQYRRELHEALRVARASGAWTPKGP